MRLLLVTMVAEIACAAEPRRVSVQDWLRINEPPIDYFSAEGTDPIADLNRKLKSEEIRLEFSNRFGYLPAVLKALDIPAESQLLKFHSGGLQSPGLPIDRKRPRALYILMKMPL